jgi:hypothetical protein
MLVDIGGVEVLDPTAVVLRLNGEEVGRKPYDGGLPAAWYCSMITFDEVVFETAHGEHTFEIPGGLPFIHSGSDIEIPGDVDPNDPWTSLVPLVPKL